MEFEGAKVGGTAFTHKNEALRARSLTRKLSSSADGGWGVPAAKRKETFRFYLNQSKDFQDVAEHMVIIIR